MLNPGHLGSPGNIRFAIKIERMVLVKKLIAFSLVACFLAISAIGCGADTKSTSGTKASTPAAGADKDKKADK